MTTTNLADKPVLQATLGQLAIAPENMRAGDAGDDQIEALALTLLTGQLQPLFVRAGDEGAPHWAVLDGRRRLLAYQALAADGRIGEGYLIAIVQCETPEEIAAATVTSNTERVDPSMADYLLAIRHQMQTFSQPADIARVLGLDPKKVRRLMALAGLDMRLLQLFKAGKVGMDSLREFARLKDPAALESLIGVAEKGHLHWGHFEAHKAQGLVADSDIGRMIDLEAYVAAGGRIERDLFEQKPDLMIDVQIAHQVWIDTTRSIADALRQEGLEVFHHATAGTGTAKGRMEIHHYTYDFSRETLKPAASEAEVDVARQALSEASDKAGRRDNAKTSTRVKRFLAKALAELTFLRLRIGPLPVSAARIKPNHWGLEFTFYVDEDAYRARVAEVGPRDDGRVPSVLKTLADKLAHVPHSRTVVDTGGFGHVLHGSITSLAGKGLARALADNPAAAFNAQLAHQFYRCAFDDHGDDQLLTISVNRMSQRRGGDPHLEAPLVDRLTAWRTAFKTSGLHPYEWVGTLDGEQKGDLFALITALQVTTFEQKNTWLKPGKRAEAAHLAVDIGHDIRNVWTPPDDFWKQFTKRQLLAFAEAMGADTKPYAKMKTPDLVAAFPELAKTHNFVPPQLNFHLAEEQNEAIAPAMNPADPDGDDDDELDEIEDEATFTDEELVGA